MTRLPAPAPAREAVPSAAGLTQDGQLGGRVRLAQPASGYRAAIDPVLLAAFVPAARGDIVLDAGMGVGSAALCLAARVPQCRVLGLEIQPGLVRLAQDNIRRNGQEGRVEAHLGSLAAPPAEIESAEFTRIMTNPPYHRGGTAPPDGGKALANAEGDIALDGWLRLCLRLLRPGGVLTLIHRADRLDDLVAALRGRAGDITLFPLWPKAGSPAKRMLIRARKGSGAPVRLLPGLVLHEEDGGYTAGAQSILRDAAPISA